MRRCGLPTNYRTVATVLAAVASTVVILTSAWAGPPPPVHSEGELPAKLLAKPVIVYSRPYTGAIYADYVPSAREVRARFGVSMARNEYEPMQVGLYVPAGREALNDVALEINCPIPSRVGRIHYSPVEEQGFLAGVEETPLKPHSWRWPVDAELLVGRRVSMPLYVVPVARITAIEPGRSAAFWVTFQTDGTVAAGTHKGTLTLSADGRVLETIPFSVKVHPFLLPRPKTHYGMYHIYNRPELPYQGREFLRQSMEDMAAHGMNFPQFEHLALAFKELAQNPDLRWTAS